MERETQSPPWQEHEQQGPVGACPLAKPPRLAQLRVGGEGKVGFLVLLSRPLLHGSKETLEVG